MQALGGLHVIGTERHESRRIDNQLRGRAGRQGDPGSTRFFLSLEDNLFRCGAGGWGPGAGCVRLGGGGCKGAGAGWLRLAGDRAARGVGAGRRQRSKGGSRATASSPAPGSAGPPRRPPPACLHLLPPAFSPPLPARQDLWRRQDQEPDGGLPRGGPAHGEPDADGRAGHGAEARGELLLRHAQVGGAVGLGFGGWGAGGLLGLGCAGPGLRWWLRWWRWWLRWWLGWAWAGWCRGSTAAGASAPVRRSMPTC